MTTDYQTFLAAKHVQADTYGFGVDDRDMSPALFDWQRAVVKQALFIGRMALFEECGLGKTIQQVEWARLIAWHTSRPVLIVAPLAVAHQTIDEARRLLSVPITYVRSQAEADAAPTMLHITNYDMLKHFNASHYAGVVLDESSILKNYTGSTKRLILEMFRDTQYRLACTATPAPNDYLELGNHAEFLGVMRANEMLMRWFINNSMKAGDYRLKGHAEADFWRWVTSWAVCLSKPSDLGYSDEGFDLPPLEIREHIVQVDYDRAHENGQLFPNGNLNATALWGEKRATLEKRCALAAALIADEPNEAWVVWCDTNDEADRLKELLPDYVEVRGSHSIAQKEERLRAFSEGAVKGIITKAEIAAFGLNWQHSARHLYVGLTYSFEQFYQALRRSYRFGQKRPMIAHLISAESEGNVLATLRRKQEAHTAMQAKMNEAMREHGLGTNERRILHTAASEVAHGEDWQLYLGDCVDRIQEVESNSVALTVSSLPFANLYIYSDSIADMGNCRDSGEFFAHFGYLVPELLRITRPGGLCVMHCKDLPLYKNRDGEAGLYDFPGDIVRAFTNDDIAHLWRAREALERLELDTSAIDEAIAHKQAQSGSEGRWVLHSKITIWKDPVTEMQRTKAHGLLHKNFVERAEACRQGMADYLLVFRKWTDEMPDKQVSHKLLSPDRYEVVEETIAVNPEDAWDFGLEPGTTSVVKTKRTAKVHTHYIGTNPPQFWQDDRDYSIQVWQRYASPVWFDIDQTSVLNYELAREDQDEKHICPLQLGVIARCIDLWSNRGDVVFDPFNGIGSTGYEALKLGRRYVGIELKRAYFQHAIRNLQRAEAEAQRPTLFDLLEMPA